MCKALGFLGTFSVLFFIVQSSGILASEAKIPEPYTLLFKSVQVSGILARPGPTPETCPVFGTLF